MNAFLDTAYRLRGPVIAVSTVVLLVNVLVLTTSLPLPFPRSVWTLIILIALAALLAALLLGSLGPRLMTAPARRLVRSPASGRWRALNSPATTIPSHGTHAYGQTYAIDLVFEPDGNARPTFGGAMMRPASEYPAFGEPVFAMIDGTVVRASDGRRDHRARSNLAGFTYLFIEGLLRQLAGPGVVVGNHVVIRSDDGIFAAVAHLQRGSLAVRVGERVTAGAVLGACGNSGNSSEPHIHAQLMDRASWWTARGIPMDFAGILLGDDSATHNALPANGVLMTGPGAPRRDEAPRPTTA